MSEIQDVKDVAYSEIDKWIIQPDCAIRVRHQPRRALFTPVGIKGIEEGHPVGNARTAVGRSEAAEKDSEANEGGTRAAVQLAVASSSGMSTRGLECGPTPQ